MLKKCELCSVEPAAAKGRLCTACHEAIARLLAIREAERSGHGDPLEEIVMYPNDVVAGGDGQARLRELPHT